MKKITFLVASLMLCFGAMAQFPNSGFENWTAGTAPTHSTDLHPDGGWYSPFIGQGYIDNDAPEFLSLLGYTANLSIAGVTPAHPTTKSTVAPAQGNANLSLQTYSLNITAPATITKIIGSALTQKIADTTKYQYLIFDYKDSLTSNDTSFVVVQTFAGTTITGQGILYITSNHLSWTTDSILINYSLPNPIDSISILFTSSIGGVITGHPNPTQDGSKLQIDAIQLITSQPTVYASVASNIVASDIGNNGNGTDLQVTFNAAANESTVSEYRVFAVDSGYQSANWSAEPTTMYGVVTPNGSSSYTYTFTAASKCLSGAPYTITVDSAMQVYVLSVAGGSANTDSVAGPSNTITLTNDTTTGITNLSLAKNEVKVFPNPANNAVNFMFQNTKVASRIAIYSTTGKLVKTTSVSRSLMTKVDLSSFSSGLYFYHIIGNNNQILKSGKLQVLK